jgi:AcrR family transcriptional regulator
MGNREDLLAGAKRCLLEKGYARTTVRDIAGAAGVSMAAIGYHYGSREALLNEAMFEAMSEWYETLERRIGQEIDPAGTPAERYAQLWAAIVGVAGETHALWLATYESFVVAMHDPDLKKQLAGGQWEGTQGLAAAVTGTPEDEVDEATARSIGAVQTALLSGIMTQHLLDPDHAPTAGEVLAGLRAIGRLAGA